MQVGTFTSQRPYWKSGRCVRALQHLEGASSPAENSMGQEFLEKGFGKSAKFYLGYCSLVRAEGRVLSAGSAEP